MLESSTHNLFFPHFLFRPLLAIFFSCKYVKQAAIIARGIPSTVLRMVAISDPTLSLSEADSAVDVDLGSGVVASAVVVVKAWEFDVSVAVVVEETVFGVGDAGGFAVARFIEKNWFPVCVMVAIGITSSV